MQGGALLPVQAEKPPLQFSASEWTFEVPLRVCFATEAIAYTSICAAHFPPPGSEGLGLPEFDSQNDCAEGEYCGFDFALWQCASAHLNHPAAGDCFQNVCCRNM